MREWILLQLRDSLRSHRLGKRGRSMGSGSNRGGARYLDRWDRR